MPAYLPVIVGNDIDEEIFNLNKSLEELILQANEYAKKAELQHLKELVDELEIRSSNYTNNVNVWKDKKDILEDNIGSYQKFLKEEDGFAKKLSYFYKYVKDLYEMIVAYSSI